jgi:hypothetical protein
MFDVFAAVGQAESALSGLAGGFDPAGLDRDGSVALLDRLGRVRRLTDGLIAKTAERVAATEGAGRSGDRDAAATCAKALRSSSGEARGLIWIGQKLAESEVLDAAVRAGELTPKEASLIADTTKLVPGAEVSLLAASKSGMRALEDACRAERAKVESGQERSRRQRAARFLRMWKDPDGMIAGRFALPPEIGGPIRVMVDDHVQRTFRSRKGADQEPHDRYAADALAEAFLGATSATMSEPRVGNDTATRAPDMGDAATDGTQDRLDATGNDLVDRSGGATSMAPSTRAGSIAPNATVHVLIDFAAIVRGDVLPGERCEIAGVGDVNLEWVRSLLGNAFLTAVIKHGRDIKTVAHFGRHINAHLRTALIVGGRECVVEHCGAHGYLEIDHRDDHAAHGPTALSNLDYICPLDHHRKTNGWTLGPANPATGKRKLHPPGHTQAA